MLAHIHTYPIRRFVGFSTLLRESAEAPNRYDGIPTLWAKLRAAMESIPTRIGTDRFALIEGDFLEKSPQATYSALVEVQAFDGISEEMERFEYTGVQLAVFDGQGPPSSVNQLTLKVLHEWVPQTEHRVSANRELFVFSEAYVPTDPTSAYQFVLFI